MGWDDGLRNDITNSKSAVNALPKRLEKLISPSRPLGLFWVSVKSFALFERLYGLDAGEQVMLNLERILGLIVQDILSGTRSVVMERMDQDSLIILFQNGDHTLDQMMDKALNLRMTAKSMLNEKVVGLTGNGLNLDVGCSEVMLGPEDNLSQKIFQAADDAKQMARGILDEKSLPLMAEFRALLKENGLYAVYQPIVNLQSGGVLGWESLARGPQKGFFSSPVVMFDFAEEVGQLFPLERTCRKRGIEGLGSLATGQKLFLNIHPKTMADPDFRRGETRMILEKYGISPSNVVFEITERHSIKDFGLFYRTLQHYRSQGFKVAIDDAGTGFSGLNRIARLKPDFLKTDMSLVRGIDSNPVQRALMETFVTFADKIGCSVIAEGIETEAELSCLASMGVHYGQGFYIARPANPKPRIEFTPPPSAASLHQGGWKCSIPLSDLLEPAPFAGPKSTVREVKALMDRHPMTGVVVVENEMPVGLAMSHTLDRQLGTQYGTALYYDRPVSAVMDSSPLVAEGSMPVESVATKAMARERFKLYDHIVVTSGGKFKGVVSVQKMLDALARVQVEMAKGANPLTGLPGNLALEAEVEKRCQGRGLTSIVYVDLDNFKIFNDTYGFESGDKVLRLLSDILSWACRRHGQGYTFVGHIGGDDFVIMSEAHCVERICRGVVRCFKRLVRKLYNTQDARRGYVLAKGRDGKEGKFPLVSVSMGIMDISGSGACDLAAISHRAAEVKKYAKSKNGNVYVRDRRKPLGEPDD
jgi:diguanylate cyclase (GGDEF)-like protein